MPPVFATPKFCSSSSAHLHTVSCITHVCAWASLFVYWAHSRCLHIFNIYMQSLEVRFIYQIFLDYFFLKEVLFLLNKFQSLVSAYYPRNAMPVCFVLCLSLTQVLCSCIFQHYVFGPAAARKGYHYKVKNIYKEKLNIFFAPAKLLFGLFASNINKSAEVLTPESLLSVVKKITIKELRKQKRLSIIICCYQEIFGILEPLLRILNL